MRTVLLILCLVLPALGQSDKPQWTYYNGTTTLGESTASASIQSTNTVELGFPYAGSQRATLSLSRVPLGYVASLSIERGQLTPSCSANYRRFRGYQQTCVVRVRFDNGAVMLASVLEPTAPRTSMLFTDYNSWLKAIRTSQKVRVEVNLYNEGTRTFDFDVRGLNW